MKNFKTVVIFLTVTSAGCTQINMQPVAGPLSEIEPIPIVNGTARSLRPTSGNIRFRMPSGQSCSSSWSSASRLIECDEGMALALGVRASDRPTIIGIAKDNGRNIFALRTDLLVQPQLVQFCLDESISYASGMARCLDEGKSEAQCERENAGAASAEVACWMREMEGYRKWIVELIRFPLPPLPGPVSPID